jgi:hypothetical protein
MSPVLAYRSAVVLLWALAVLNAAICRGLFWDGASFLAIVLDTGWIRDYYPAREHVSWVTQGPLLPLIGLGITSTKTFAIVYSALLFVWPTALYTLALARVRRDPALLAALLAALAAIYLPTSFFIVGEYNLAYAAVIAAAAIALLPDRARPRRDGAMLFALGFLCIASYESMLYLGPLMAVLIVWSMRRRSVTDPMARLLMGLSALAFVGSMIVSLQTIAEFWDHPYFAAVRAASLHFWENLQFIVPFAALALMFLLSLFRPAWLRGRGPLVVLAVVALLLATLPWLHRFSPNTMLFPPAHYIARTAAGWLVALLVIAMAVHVGWKRPFGAFAEFRRPEIGRRLVAAAWVLLLGATVPDLALDRLWVDYLGYFRGLVTANTGLVQAKGLPLQVWPQRLFSQDWTYPAMSALLRDRPGQGIVVMADDYRSNPPFDPKCGTVPKLDGMSWR